MFVARKQQTFELGVFKHRNGPTWIATDRNGFKRFCRSPEFAGFNLGHRLKSRGKRPESELTMGHSN
jgi:hypothetical protein